MNVSRHRAAKERLTMPKDSAAAPMHGIVRRCVTCDSTEIVDEPIEIGPPLPLCHQNRCREMIQPIKFRDPFDPAATDKFERCFHCKRKWSDIPEESRK